MPANPFTTGASVKVNADTSSFNNAIGGATDSLMSFKKQVALAGGMLGTFAAGGLAAATNQARSFDEAIIELSKRVGKDQANEMREGISEMAEEITLTREEVAGLADDAARFGIEGEESILKFTESVAKMGEATTLNTEEAGKSMAKLAELTNTPVSEIENLGSAINSLSNNFATSSQEIVDSMLRSSGALSQLGLNQKEIAGLSASLNEVSASSRRAGTRLRRVAQEMMDPKKTKDIAEALGLTVEEFKTMREESPKKAMMQLVTAMNEGGDAADKIRTTFSTASRQALAGFAQNLDGTRDALELSNKQFKEASSLQREFDREMAKTSSSIQIAKSRLNGIAIEIGNNVLPVFNKLLRKTVIPAIDKFSKWNEEMGGMPATIGLVATAVGGFTVAGAALVSMLGGMSAILGAVGTAFTVLTGPIGIAVAAIAALGFAWKKNLGDIRGKTKTALTWVKNFIKNVVAGIKQFWRQFGNRIIKTTKRAFNIVKTIVGDVLSALWVDLIKPTLNDIQSFWQKHGNKIINATKRAFNKILVLVNKALTKIQKFWAKNGDKIMANVTGFLKTVMKLYKKYIMFVWKQIIKPTLGAIQKFWNKHGDEIIKATKNAFSTILTFINNTLTKIKKFWNQRGKDMLASAVETFKQIKKTIVQTMTFVWETIIKPTLKDIKRLWKEHGKGLVRDAKEAYNTIKENVMTTLNFLWNKVIKPTLKLIRGFWNKHGEQIMSWVKTVFKTVQGITSAAMNTILTAIRVILNLISGDWKEAWTLIKDLAKDLLTGIVDWIKGPGKKMFLDAWGIAVGVIKDIWNGFIDWLFGNSKIQDLFKDIKEWVRSTGKSLMKKAWKKIKEKIQDVLDWLTGTGDNSLLGEIKSVVGDIKDWVISTGKSKIKTAWERIIGAVKNAISYLTGTGEGTLYNDITTFFDDAYEYLSGSGKILLKYGMQAAIGGIKDAVDYLIGTGENTLYNDIVSAFGDIKDEIADLGNAAAGLFEGAFNAVIPGSIGIPEAEIFGNWVTLPTIEIGDKEFGGGKAHIPGVDIGGDSINLPQLQSGGFIEESGLAMLHSGEQVVPAADVNRGGGLDPNEIEQAVARGMMQAAQNEDLANINIEFRDTERYNAVRR